MDLPPTFEITVKYLDTVEAVQPHHMKVKAARKRIRECIASVPRPGQEERQMKTMLYLMGIVGVKPPNTIVDWFASCVTLEYLRKIQITYKGLESTVDTYLFPYFLDKARLFQLEAGAAWETSENPVLRTLLNECMRIGRECEENFCAQHVPDFPMSKAMAMNLIIKEELVQKTCHPSRCLWFLDEDDKKEIFAM
jgi:hypothetical protein